MEMSVVNMKAVEVMKVKIREMDEVIEVEIMVAK